MGVTPDVGCTREEVARRAKIRSNTVFVKILVNDQVCLRIAVFAVGSACQSVLSKQVLTSSPYARLQWPSFQAAVAADVSIDVTHRPNSIEVQVWEAGWIYNSIIARASVPIPGALPLLPLDVPSFRYPCLTLHSVNV